MDTSSSNPNQNNNYPNPTPLKKKSTGGRRKLPMEKIKNETNRQVTFSKRKGGLVKKASELSTLTGIEIALVVFSPSGKPYSYGNPSVERVASRLMYANAYTHEERAPGSVMHGGILSRQNEAIAKSQAQVEVERNRARELVNMEAAVRLSGTYPTELETSRYDEICALIESIQEFERSLEAKVNEAKDIATSAKLLKAPQQLLHQGGQHFFPNVIGSSSSSHILQRGSPNVVRSSSLHLQQNQVQDHNHIAPEVFVNNNIVNDNVNPYNKGMYTGQFFNPGGFASYNPSSLRNGGSSSFAFPSSRNAGELASVNAMKWDDFKSSS